MKKTCAIWLAAAFAAAWGCGTDAFGAGVRVVRGEGVAESLAEAVAQTLAENASVGASVVPGAPRGDGEDAAAHALRSGGGGEGLALVLVDWPGEEIGGKAWVEDGVALLNVARLGDGETPAQTLAARAGRETLRAYAHLMGVPPCPFPLCVLAPCGSVEALDGMSRSYCPPCWERVRLAAAERGFDVLPVAGKPDANQED